MPEIQAFRGVRYNLGRVGSLSDVVTPPYDVIGPELQDQFYKQHPNSFIRIDLNKIEPGDDDEKNNRYTRAAKFYKQWLAEGILTTEGEPAIYVYHQEFDAAGTKYVRRGFLCRQWLTRFGEGQVFPHEETLPAAKVDRLMLTVTTKAQMSPIFGLYPDKECEAQSILDQAVAGKTPLVATDHLGVVHRMWPVTDVSVIAKLSAIMGPKPLFIADGHHRYETACNYCQQIHDSGFLSPTHPANYTLMMCVAMDDPGLIVMPTHRLFRSSGRRADGTPLELPPEKLAMTSDQLKAKLGACFTTRPAGQGPDAAATVWEDIETSGQQGSIGLYTQKDGKWIIATVTEAGNARMAELAKDHTDAWRGLGVSLLHRLIVEDLLGCKDLPKPSYVHLIQEVADGLKTGEFPLAAVVMPATVDHVRQISMGGERMPAKSTYFYPKLLSGLVINPLE
ncbi:MAG: DUF1015 domain-containing protein [Planctomycetaceae bacterium]|nr:DUF1015 domain-containing protein [Planctomycetaceae bacterium]